MKTTKQQRQEEKCNHDYDNPIRKGRADYHCRKCGADITLDLVCLEETKEGEEQADKTMDERIKELKAELKRKDEALNAMKKLTVENAKSFEVLATQCSDKAKDHALLCARMNREAREELDYIPFSTE